MRPRKLRVINKGSSNNNKVTQKESDKIVKKIRRLPEETCGHRYTKRGVVRSHLS